MLIPTDILAANPHLTLTINSTEDTRKVEFRDNYNKYANLDPDSVAIRYEPDTEYMFIDSSWLDDDTAADLCKNTQYKGKTSVRLLKGTGHNVPTRIAHVFDLKATSALRATDHTKRDNYRRSLMRDLNGNIPEVASKLAEFDLQEKNINAHESLEEQVYLLKRRVKSLQNDILRMLDGKNPISYQKRQRRKFESLGRMDSLTVYIRDHKPSFSYDISKIVVTNRIPEHTHSQHLTPHAPLGTLKETTNPDGSNHKKRLYISINHLKKIVPNYRRDCRYITSQTTYVKHLDADGNPTTTNIYCAVFDLLKSEQNP